MIFKTMWAITKDVPDELKAAYKVAVRDQSVRNEVSRIVAALHRLIDEAGFHTELQDAVLESTSTGGDVIEILQDRRLDVLSQIEMVQVEKDVYAKQNIARHGEVQTVLHSCMLERDRLVNEITTLQDRISGFNKSRIEAGEKYKLAGLNDAQIEAIGGITPTDSDLVEWMAQIAEKQTREQQILTFYGSSPEYDTSILDVVKNTQAA